MSELNEKLRAYQVFVSNMLTSITVDPSYHVNRLLEAENNVVKELTQAGMDMVAASEHGINSDVVEMVHLRVKIPLINSRAEETKKILYEFISQEDKINSTLNTIRMALQYISMVENNSFMELSEGLAELEAAAINKEIKEE